MDNHISLPQFNLCKAGRDGIWNGYLSFFLFLPILNLNLIQDKVKFIYTGEKLDLGESIINYIIRIQSVKLLEIKTRAFKIIIKTNKQQTTKRKKRKCSWWKLCSHFPWNLVWIHLPMFPFYNCLFSYTMIKNNIL